MIKSKFPLITCRLSDRNGNALNPCVPGAIRYTELSSPKDRPQEQVRLLSGKTVLQSIATVLIEGFVTFSTDENRMSSPIPFSIVQYISLCAPQETVLFFATDSFQCCAIPLLREPDAITDRVKIFIHIETTAESRAKVTLRVPEVDSSLAVKGTVCLHTDKIYGSAVFKSETEICYQSMVLKAEVYQYNALSADGQKTYTNQDELTQYGDRGILSPDEVSYCNLFVNGVLQPKTNYRITKGLLNLTTEDAPGTGQAVMILFVTLKNQQDEKMKVTDNRYNAVSDGTKKIFTDADELKAYGGNGIPDPNEVSYFNLYINGVLQPTGNYLVRKGVLELTTEDIPSKGELIILESLVIRDPRGQLFRMDTYQFNALSEGRKIFTDRDQILMYGDKGIPDPKLSVYQNLFVNGVLQPGVNYLVYEGFLLLKTQDAPIRDAPISLQYVSQSSANSAREYGMSSSAYRRWIQRYEQVPETELTLPQGDD